MLKIVLTLKFCHLHNNIPPDIREKLSKLIKPNEAFFPNDMQIAVTDALIFL